MVGPPPCVCPLVAFPLWVGKAEECWVPPYSRKDTSPLGIGPWPRLILTSPMRTLSANTADSEQGSGSHAEQQLNPLQTQRGSSASHCGSCWWLCRDSLGFLTTCKQEIVYGCWKLTTKQDYQPRVGKRGLENLPCSPWVQALEQCLYPVQALIEDSQHHRWLSLSDLLVPLLPREDQNSS